VGRYAIGKEAREHGNFPCADTNHKPTANQNVCEMDVANDIRSALPNTDEIVVQYLNGLFEEPDEEYDSIMDLTQRMLESFADSDKTPLNELLEQLGTLLTKQLAAREAVQRPTLTKLDRIMEMNKSLSTTRAMTDGVDLSTINKGK
jgi:ATP-binding cassette subfamily F protein 3